MSKALTGIEKSSVQLPVIDAEFHPPKVQGLPQLLETMSDDIVDQLSP